jgi:hypothetical protein
MQIQLEPQLVAACITKTAPRLLVINATRYFMKRPSPPEPLVGRRDGLWPSTHQQK